MLDMCHDGVSLSEKSFSLERGSRLVNPSAFGSPFPRHSHQGSLVSGDSLSTLFTSHPRPFAEIDRPSLGCLDAPETKPRPAFPAPICPIFHYLLTDHDRNFLQSVKRMKMCCQGVGADAIVRSPSCKVALGALLLISCSLY